VAEHGGDETGKWRQQSGGRGAEGPETAAAGRQGGGRLELAVAAVRWSTGGGAELHEQRVGELERETRH
jgi:hypothetical protein